MLVDVNINKVGRKKTVMIVFERKIIRRIYESKRNEEENRYERRINSELRAIFNESNIVKILLSRRIS
jgi:hypothetical protein